MEALYTGRRANYNATYWVGANVCTIGGLFFSGASPFIALEGPLPKNTGLREAS
jgi:hypothetical protein